MWVRCAGCRHVWPAVYLPMEMGKVAQVLRGLRCPKCATGAHGIVMANADEIPAKGGPA